MWGGDQLLWMAYVVCSGMVVRIERVMATRPNGLVSPRIWRLSSGGVGGLSPQGSLVVVAQVAMHHRDGNENKQPTIYITRSGFKHPLDRLFPML